MLLWRPAGDRAWVVRASDWIGPAATGRASATEPQNAARAARTMRWRCKDRMAVGWITDRPFRMGRTCAPPLQFPSQAAASGQGRARRAIADNPPSGFEHFRVSGPLGPH